MQAADSEYLLALESVSALRDAGQPVDLFIFPNEQHFKWQPAHRLAVYERNLHWFDFWFMGREDPNPIDPDQYPRWRAMKAAMPKK